MKTMTQMVLALMLLGAITSCAKNELQNIEPNQSASNAQNNKFTTSAEQGEKQVSWLEQSQVYYDYHNFHVQLKKVIDEPGYSNPSFKYQAGVLYVYDVRNTAPAWQGRAFTAVSSKEIEPGTTMLWNKVLVRFNPGNTPRQFYSWADLVAASNGAHPAVTLIQTGLVYEGKLLAVDETKMPEAMQLAK